MEKNTILGELLYIGFVFEKGRCKPSGIWKRSYTRSLNWHIELLKEATECMQKRFQIEDDNIFLKKMCHEIQVDTILKNYYPFKNVLNKMDTSEAIITYCQDEIQHIEIINLMLRLLEDILTELGRGLRKDKEKICKMLFALHNLPRVYLSKEADTLCLLGESGITPEDAFVYSKLSMDKDMLSSYRHYFVYD